MAKWNMYVIVLVVFTISFITMWQYSSSIFRYDKAILQCCQDNTKECWACQKRETIFEFCSVNSGRLGCPEIPSTKKCCTDHRKECLACLFGTNVEEFCERHPGHYECSEAIKPIPKCCKELSKECLACVNEITVEKFCEKYAGQFGCAGDVMIAIQHSNKTGIMNFTSSVWRKYHNIPEMHLHIFKASPLSHTDNLKIREGYGNHVRIIVSQENSEHVKEIFQYFLSSDYKILLLADVETIVSKDWKSFILTSIHNSTDGFLSLYHSSAMHNYTVDCEHMIDNLCEGDAIGRFGVAFTKPLVAKILKNNKGSFDKTLNWAIFLKDINIRLMYPSKSLSMQIGQINQLEDNCGENEVPYRFNRCEFPQWIQNGIEFYFDRCTSPIDEFLPDKSMDDIEKEGRFWARPAISYCLYSDQYRYNQLARQNFRRVFSIYPGWKIWIYTDGTAAANTKQEFCEFNIRVIDMSKTKIQSKMSWRFLVASAPVKMYAVRDIDSWLLQRGKEAVDEWIRSGRKFHTIRDHPNHANYAMNGGMWGGYHDSIPNMKELLESRQMNNNYMTDMNFLNSVVWKVAKNSVWAHDSHSLHRFGEDHPFPTKQRGRNLFVGNYFKPDIVIK